MKTSPLTLLVLGLTLLAPPPAGAQDDPAFSIAPALIGDPGDLTPGLRVRVERSVDRPFYGDRPFLLQAAVEADLPFTLDAASNPETLELEASLLGLFIRPWGYVQAGVEVGAEAEQRVDDADVSVGLNLQYDHDRAGPWYAVPRIELAYDLVACAGCDVADTDDEYYHRLDLRADWSVSLRVLDPGLQRLRFRPALRWFRAARLGPSLATVRNERGLWGRIQLGYFPAPDWLYEVYVNYRGGELPVMLREESAWSLGASVVF